MTAGQYNRHVEQTGSDLWSLVFHALDADDCFNGDFAGRIAQAAQAAFEQAAHEDTPAEYMPRRIATS
jgi:hypothetical protein